jgi:hypothetical protein
VDPPEVEAPEEDEVGDWLALQPALKRISAKSRRTRRQGEKVIDSE